MNKVILDNIQDNFFIKLNQQGSWNTSDIKSLYKDSIIEVLKNTLSDQLSQLELDDDRAEFLRQRRYLKTDLYDLDVSVRALKALESLDIKTLADLIPYEPHDFLKIKGLGKKTLNEIRDLVRSKGLSFGMDLSKFHHL